MHRVRAQAMQVPWGGHLQGAQGPPETSAPSLIHAILHLPAARPLLSTTCTWLEPSLCIALLPTYCFGLSVS